MNKINNIEIKPLNKFKTKLRTIQEPLPDPYAEQPFLWLISAKVASGKSVLISNLLRNIYFRYFDRVYFCSSNIKGSEIYDIAYKSIQIPENRLFDDFNEDIMIKIKEDIEEDEDFEDSQYLLVIDDLPVNLNKRVSKITKTMIKHRHIHLSIIITTQKLNLLNLSLRNNCSHLVVFKTNNKNERDSLSSMVEIDEDEFLNTLDYATREKFNFLYVDLSKNPTQFYQNFNYLLDSKNLMNLD